MEDNDEVALFSVTSDVPLMLVCVEPFAICIIWII